MTWRQAFTLGARREWLGLSRMALARLLGVDPASIFRKVPEGEFTFLGYSFGRMYSAKTGKAYLGYIRHVKSPLAWIVHPMCPRTHLPYIRKQRESSGREAPIARRLVERPAPVRV